MVTTSLDLGCGKDPKNPFGALRVFGVDLLENEELSIRKADLAIEAIPFDDQSFDFISAFDFIEHIPRVVYMPERKFPFVELMNEIFRVLKPGGHFLSFTPAYPVIDAFSDPTHVNIITENTFPVYFCNGFGASIYGFSGGFELVQQKWHDWVSWPIAVGPGSYNPGKTHLVTLLKRPVCFE